MEQPAAPLGQQRRAARPLRCSRPVARSMVPAEAPRCRICWEGDEEGNPLVAPCACAGSMVSLRVERGDGQRWHDCPCPLVARRLNVAAPAAVPIPCSPLLPHPPPQRHVHRACLTAWQQQLRASKGVAACRRCDVCRARWARAHQPTLGPTDWRQMLRDVCRSVPWHAVLEVGGWQQQEGQCAGGCSRRATGCARRRQAGGTGGGLPPGMRSTALQWLSEAPPAVSPKPRLPLVRPYALRHARLASHATLLLSSP